MSGETEVHPSSWTTDTVLALFRSLREADHDLAQERDRRWQEVLAERDRRYSEVKAAEEKALQVKETADKDALSLAREIQTYKDEKANELREQINRERGLYVTQSDLKAVVDKVEIQLQPLKDFATGTRSGSSSVAAFKANQLTYITALLIVIGIVAGVIGHNFH